MSIEKAFWTNPEPKVGLCENCDSEYAKADEVRGSGALNLCGFCSEDCLQEARDDFFAHNGIYPEKLAKRPRYTNNHTNW